MDNVLNGRCSPKPLILRANAGDWIEVTLHNAWDVNRPVPYFSYPRVPLDKKHRPSMRVSINPQFLRYDPVCDSGINVGYNQREQTIGVGESKKYLWHADREYGACIIQSFGDLRNHRYHGLFGVIIIEPAGAQWYRNFSLKKSLYEEQAVITAPGEEAFREFVLFIQNGIRLLDQRGRLIQTAAEEGEPLDAEDTGEKGYNYRSERFANRLKKDKRVNKVFSSRIHGDPATPLLRAYPEDPFSRVIPLQGAISIGNRFTMELSGGASCPGDYLYRSGSLKWDVESGMWGILRVMNRGIGCKCRRACRKVMDSFSKNG